jgi:hypothetical protein
MQEGFTCQSTDVEVPDHSQSMMVIAMTLCVRWRCLERPVRFGQDMIFEWNYLAAGSGDCDFSIVWQ